MSLSAGVSKEGTECQVHPSPTDEEAQRLIAIVVGTERRAWMERKQAAGDLVALGEPAVLPIVRVVESGNYGFTTLLLSALGELGDARAVPALIHTLREINPHVRQEAAKALGSLGDPRAVEPLIAAFRVGSGDTEDITAWQDASFALAQIGEPALSPLLSALTDMDLKARAQSAVALGRLGDRRAVRPLIAALSDPEAQVRIDAAEALSRIGDIEAVDALVSRLDDHDESARVYAVRALGFLIKNDVFAPLVAALGDPATDVRCEALRALARSAGPKALDLVLAHVADADVCVRHAAVRTLARVGNASLFPLLERIEREDQGRCKAVWVKDAARYARECIQRRMAGDPTWWKAH